MKNKNFNLNFLHISNFKRKSLYVLLLFIVVCFFIPRIYLYYTNTQALLIIEKSSISSEIDSDMTSYLPQNRVSQKEKRKHYKGLKRKSVIEELTVSDWMQVGLSERQAYTLHSIASKGIENEQQLKQIKYLPEELFLRIKDSLVYTQKKPMEQEQVLRKNKHFDGYANLSVSVNTSDYAQLLEVPGIGNATANGIIKYRSLLGGFYAPWQLLEVYTIRPENFEKMKPHLLFDSLQIVKINLNNVGVDELKKHPYLTWNQANSIVKMRIQSGGKFEKIEEILNSDLIDEEIYNKLRPYLSLQ